MVAPPAGEHPRPAGDAPPRVPKAIPKAIPEAAHEPKGSPPAPTNMSG